MILVLLRTIVVFGTTEPDVDREDCLTARTASSTMSSSLQIRSCRRQLPYVRRDQAMEDPLHSRDPCEKLNEAQPTVQSETFPTNDLRRRTSPWKLDDYRTEDLYCLKYRQSIFSVSNLFPWSLKTPRVNGLVRRTHAKSSDAWMIFRVVDTSPNPELETHLGPMPASSSLHVHDVYCLQAFGRMGP